MQARLYKKSCETREKANDAYGALLAARNGERYGPNRGVWRLEFQLRREGVKGFWLCAPPEVDDSDEEIEAELAAEELQPVGTLPRFFGRLLELFSYLTRYCRSQESADTLGAQPSRARYGVRILQRRDIETVSPEQQFHSHS